MNAVSWITSKVLASKRHARGHWDESTTTLKVPGELSIDVYRDAKDGALHIAYAPTGVARLRWALSSSKEHRERSRLGDAFSPWQAHNFKVFAKLYGTMVLPIMEAVKKEEGAEVVNAAFMRGPRLLESVGLLDPGSVDASLRDANLDTKTIMGVTGCHLATAVGRYYDDPTAVKNTPSLAAVLVGVDDKLWNQVILGWLWLAIVVAKAEAQHLPVGRHCKIKLALVGNTEIERKFTRMPPAETTRHCYMGVRIEDITNQRVLREYTFAEEAPTSWDEDAPEPPYAGVLRPR